MVRSRPSTQRTEMRAPVKLQDEFRQGGVSPYTLLELGLVLQYKGRLVRVTNCVPYNHGGVDVTLEPA